MNQWIHDLDLLDLSTNRTGLSLPQPSRISLLDSSSLDSRFPVNSQIEMDRTVMVDRFQVANTIPKDKSLWSGQ